MHIAHNKVTRVLFFPFLFGVKWLGTIKPELLVRIRYFVRFHRKLNLDAPQTLNEKILYLSLRTDTEKWSQLANKYSVREFVKNCGLEDILIKIYAYWDNKNDINLDILPNSFVVKSVQGSGDVILVQDKRQIDHKVILRAMYSMLHNRYGALEGGKHYLRINPAVIVEELLSNSKGQSLIDYKIWCFNGKVYYIMTCSNRKSDSVCLGLYDKEWNYHPDYLVFSSEYTQELEPLPKPKNLEIMFDVAEKLSKSFPCVRVDLYNINGKIYFGEMTFTSLGGLMNYYTDEFQKKAGDIIDLNYGGE